MFPDDGITKGDLATYYETVTPLMLPHVQGRPITMERYPAGIGKKGFWQKRRREGISRVARACRGAEERRRRASPGDHRRAIADVGDRTRTPLRSTCGSRACRSCITRTSACSTSIRPADDPAAVRAAAIGLRDLLESSGCRRGSRPPAPRASTLWYRSMASRTWQKSSASRTRSAGCSCRHAPDHLTQEFSKADRKGRIYVDTGRNGYSATFAAAYTVRAKPGAPVSAPCTWEEIEKGKVDPDTFTHSQHAGADQEDWRHLGRPAAQPAILESRDRKTEAFALEPVTIPLRTRSSFFPSAATIPGWPVTCNSSGGEDTNSRQPLAFRRDHHEPRVRPPVCAPRCGRAGHVAGPGQPQRAARLYCRARSDYPRRVIRRPSSG